MLYQKQRITHDVRVRLTTSVLKSYLKKPYAFHLESNSSELFRNMTIAVGHLTTNFLFALILISAEAIILLAIASFLICLYPVITVFLGGFFILALVAINLFLRKRIKVYAAKRQRASEEAMRASMPSRTERVS